MKLFPPTWSIVRRLTLLYSVSLFLIIAVAAGFLDWVLTNDMRSDSEQFLTAEIQSFRTLLRERPDDVNAWREEVEKEAGSLKGFARYYMRVLDEQGRSLVETPGMSSLIQTKAFPQSAPPFNMRISGVEMRSSDGRLFLLAAQWVELPTPDARRCLVQIAFDRSHDTTIIGDYRKKVLGVLLGGLLLSATLGFFIAKGGLRPLSDMGAAFRRITPERLSARVSSTRWPPEVSSLARAFDSMLERLETSFSLLSQFSADLAHEIRTPINNLRGETEVVLQKPRTADEYTYLLQSNLEEYERLTRVIESLLFLARSDSHNTEMRPARLNARHEIDSVIDYFDALAEEKGITVSVSGNALVTADPSLFRRALTNLLSNAFHYTDMGGRVALAVTASKSDVEIAVTDSGIGIDAADLKNVMGRFFRSQKARTFLPEGTGLGLSIVKAIMDLHSGHIAIESLPGKGTTVRLVFPL
jgi:two-component system, OmpR family, heavy metal sensor histidine kinase CusS